MKTLRPYPNGSPCTLRDCPPGVFEYRGELGVKLVKPIHEPGPGHNGLKCVSLDGKYWFFNTDVVIVQPLVMSSDPCDHVWSTVNKHEDEGAYCEKCRMSMSNFEVEKRLNELESIRLRRTHGPLNS